MKERDYQHILVYLYAGFAALVAFWTYVNTLAPTVSFFDSGELISAAYSLGIAHPPGYPLYVLLGWLFSKLPIGTVIAYRLNVMSAVFAALACVMVYWISYLLLREPGRERRILSAVDTSKPEPERMLQPVIALIAALSFAFSITHWQHAVIAEVYSLNAFLCGLIVLLLVLWYRRSAVCRRQEAVGSWQEAGASGNNPLPTAHCPLPTAHWLLYLTALIFGLGFGNHQTIVLLAFAACFLVLGTTPRIMRHVKTLVLVLLFLALGLSIYLLVPLRAAQNPPINWGNPSSWTQFKWLVGREGYKNVARGQALDRLWDELKGHETPEDGASAQEKPQAVSASEGKGIARLFRVARASLFLKQLHSFKPLEQFGFVGGVLIALGLLYGLWARRMLTLTLVVAIVSLVLIIVVIGDPPEANIFLVEEFHTPAYLLLAVLLGMGAMAFSKGVLWVAFKQRTLQYVLVFILSVFFLIPPAAQMLKNVTQVDRRRNYVAYDYAVNVMTSLQENAILFTWGDSGAFPLWYLQIVEQQRPDVLLIHVPHLAAPWFLESLPQDLFSAADPFGRHIGDLPGLLDEIVRTQAAKRPIYFDFSSSSSLDLPYPLLPNGITFKVKLKDDVLDEDLWSRYRFRGILDNSVIALDPDIERTFFMYGSARTILGNYYLDRDNLEKASAEFNMAVKFEPSLGEGIIHSLKFRDKMGGEQPFTATQPGGSPQ